MILHVLLMIFLNIGARCFAANSAVIYADDDVQNYLMKFGYLPESDRETGNLRTDDQLRAAIRHLQSYGGIPVTGEIDQQTRKLMSSRRCGLADHPDRRFAKTRHRRYTIHGQKWPYRNLTWSLRTEQPGGLETGGVRRELSKALNLWAINSKLTFQEINSDQADILVYFYRGYHGDGYPFDGRGQILAHAFFPGRDRGGDAHFDEEEIWLLENDTNEEGTSLFAVAAHEFGHSLGLAHSSVRGALMYPWYQGLTKDYKLPEDDRHGIEQMYGASEEKLWANLPTGQAPPVTSTTTSTTTQRTTTSRRAWRPVTRPNRYPDDRYGRRDRYPIKPDYRTERPDYRPPRTRKPHRHHPTPSTTTTTTTTTTTATASTGVAPTYRPRHRYRPTPRDDIPDKCDTSYDAISVIRREIYIFKGRYLWRIGDNGLYEGYPAEITRLFNLPEDIDHVDAVYERLDKKIVFFIGTYFYVFHGHDIVPGYPQRISSIGLPKDLKKIDGAMVWGHNSRTYFFSGTQYWRFDESANYVELDYPRDMCMFAGVGYNIDTVFQWTDGKTYFFKGKGYWEFDDMRMKVAHARQKASAPFWMGCEPEMETNDVDLPGRARVVLNSSQRRNLPASFLLLSVLTVSSLISIRIS